MIKFTTLTLVAGLATAATILPTSAQFFIAAPPNKPSPASTYDCAEEIGHVHRLSVQDIDGITDRSVWLQPICEGLTAARRNTYDFLFFNGNVNVHRAPIARNDLLMAELTDKGYDQFDVISLVFGAGNSVLLYVHQRDMN
jgi:hypothetical protein